MVLDKAQMRTFGKNRVVSSVYSFDAALPPTFLQNVGDAIRWLQPIRAVIFGSTVRTGLKARDIDLLVIAESLNRFLWQDRPKLLVLPLGPIYDLRLYTPEEFDMFYPLSSPLRQTIENQNINLECYYA